MRGGGKGEGGGRIHTGLERPSLYLLFFGDFLLGMAWALVLKSTQILIAQATTVLFYILVVTSLKSSLLKCMELSCCQLFQNASQARVTSNTPATAIIHFFLKSQSLNFLSWRWLATLWKVRLLSFLSSATQSGTYTALVITWCILKKVKLKKKLLEDEV